MVRKPPRRFRRARRISGVVLLLVALVQALAWQQAWQFTHFTPAGERTPDPAQMSKLARLTLLITGVTLPRPPAQPCPSGYRAIRLPLPKGEWLGAWAAPAATPAPTRATVLLFHGYGGEKGSLLPEAAFFRQMGYRVLLVDFRGGGASSGNDVTIGYREADDVRAACRYVQRYWHESRMVLFGVSMGAVASLRAVAEYPTEVRPTAMVLECPFSSTYQTVVNRFHTMGVPPVPLAGCLTFWGGAQHGYWAFGHDSRTYAHHVRTPTLLVQGTADARVRVEEAEEITAGLAGPKRLLLLAGAGHGHYIVSRPRAWRAAVLQLLTSTAGAGLATTPSLSGYLARSRQVPPAASGVTPRSSIADEVVR